MTWKAGVNSTIYGEPAGAADVPGDPCGGGRTGRRVEKQGDVFSG